VNYEYAIGEHDTGATYMQWSADPEGAGATVSTYNLRIHSAVLGSRSLSFELEYVKRIMVTRSIPPAGVLAA
jgi:hypothetical protein